MTTKTIPIFPLPIVLFPGAPQLLHIFEPRYRQMLDDCLREERRFGLIHVDPRTATDGRPPVGDVGCQVTVESVQRLPDGRANIVCKGEVRFVLEEYLTTDRLYHVARVSYFDDQPAPEEVLRVAAEPVRQTFQEVAAGTWTNQSAGGRLPEDPKELSMWLAGVLELDPAERQELLTLRSTRERLRRVHAFLGRVRDELVSEIGTGLRQRRNGRSGRHAGSATDS